jgi:hypothetical protein
LTPEQRLRTNHCDKPKIPLFLEIGLDYSDATSGRFPNSLDEQALSNSELNADIVRAQLWRINTVSGESSNATYSVNAEVYGLQERFGVAFCAPLDN